MSARVFLAISAGAVLAAAVVTASADEVTVGGHLATYHFNMEPEQSFKNLNPGLYVRTESGLTLGAYRNSLARRSAYAGWTFATRDDRFAVTVGGVTGYPGWSPVAPLLVPSVRQDLGGGWSARLAYLHKPNEHGATGLHLMLERRFGGGQ